MAASLGEAVNIGTGLETDILALVNSLAELSGAAFEPEFAPPRTGEVERITIDPAHAEAELAWRPETSLTEGLQATLDSL